MKIQIYTVLSISFLFTLAWLLNYVANATALKGTQFGPLVWVLAALGAGMFILTVRAALKAGQIAKGKA
jgi:hypothetical protein